MTEESASDHLSSRRGTITSLGQYALAVDQASQSLQGYNNADDYYSYGLNSPLQVRSAMGGYPSPPPESESRHINQKYTTEEGDFIIYAWHDKKMKWQRIKQEFARMFGRTPERTVQGLQAWYYRMNLRIPVWDEDGWLCFENEDDLEPIHVPIKCRERDSQDKPAEREIPERPIPSGPLGLAQRYPERAMLYAWVDQEFKRKAQDWGKSIQPELYLVLSLTSLSLQARTTVSRAKRTPTTERTTTTQVVRPKGRSFAMTVPILRLQR